MDSQMRLISIYLKVCEKWDEGVWISAQRFSNNTSTALTDQEVMTMYIFGTLQGFTNIKEIYHFCIEFLRDYFPTLTSYENFAYRLKILADAFVSLCEKLVDSMDSSYSKFARKLIDSMPVSIAKAKRSSRAKVAPEYADKGFCASKGEYYYGIKVHIVGNDRDHSIPVPTFIGLSPASNHDLAVFRQIAPEIIGNDIFADNAYSDKDLQQQLKCTQDTNLITPIKLRKGQKQLDSADKLYSTAVASIRQPIESLFNWLREKTKIQNACKVRSAKGLIVHVFGKIAAAIIAMMIKI